MLGTSPHPHSGVAKGFSPPQFSKEQPRKIKRVVTAPSLERWIAPRQQHHPDEEKGRSIRSISTTFMFTDLTRTHLDESTYSLQTFELSDESGLEEFKRAVDEGVQDLSGLGEAWIESVEAEKGEEEAEKMVMMSSPRKVEAAVDCSKVFSDAVQHGQGEVDLSGKRIRKIPDDICSLSHVRKLVDTTPFASRSFTRNSAQSTPARFSAPTSPSPTNSRSFFHRSVSGSLSAPSPRKTAVVPLKLDLARNELEYNSISNALFGLENLHYLFLRRNQLERLPEGIGRLTNLVELSLGSNQLEYLPAEILNLVNLADLRLHPNPFLSPPLPSPSSPPTESADTRLEPAQKTSKSRLLGPLITHFTVPSLRETALRSLLETDRTSKLPQRLVQRWEGITVRECLPSHLFAPFYSTFFPPSSASGSSYNFSYSSPHTTRTRHASNSSISSISSSSSSNPPLPPQPFDPESNVCRSPLHDNNEDGPRIFVEPAVERMEWVRESKLRPRASPEALKTTSKERSIPIRWRGCGKDCLNWLEEDEEEEEQEELLRSEGKVDVSTE